ncbi:MAG: GatB/YqeY domain-containing protein [bacterium]|nr:GatB/YqeY domain-containing protein [bacterium]
MGLKNRIQQELNSTIKERKELEALVLRQLLAAVLNKEKEKRFKLGRDKSELTAEELEKESQLQDEEIIEVISYEAKKRREAIEGFEKGGRQESVKKEKKELEILQKYLPEQLKEEELKKLVQAAIDKVNAKEMKDMGSRRDESLLHPSLRLGKVMAELMPTIKGRADGGSVSKIVKELLTESRFA